MLALACTYTRPVHDFKLWKHCSCHLTSHWSIAYARQDDVKFVLYDASIVYTAGLVLHSG